MKSVFIPAAPGFFEFDENGQEVPIIAWELIIDPNDNDNVVNVLAQTLALSIDGMKVRMPDGRIWSG